MTNVMLNARVPVGDRAALAELARRTGLSQSALLRAGLRAIVADPGLLVSAPAPAATEAVGRARVDRARPSQQPTRSRKRRKR